MIRDWVIEPLASAVHDWVIEPVVLTVGATLSGASILAFAWGGMLRGLARRFG